MTHLLALLFLCAVHLLTGSAKRLGWLWQGRFLSFASGVSFDYVFVKLLPELEKGQPVLQATYAHYANKYVYVVALLGVLFYYGMQKPSSKIRPFWVPITGYAFLNFLVGASLADPLNPDVQPIPFFALAMALHYFVNDHTLEEQHRHIYEKWGRWILIGALLTGFLIGYETLIPQNWIILAMSFVAGGVLLNVLHYELPKRDQFFYFCLGALLFTTLMIQVGVA